MLLICNPNKQAIRAFSLYTLDIINQLKIIRDGHQRDTLRKRCRTIRQNIAFLHIPLNLDDTLGNLTST